MTGRVTYRRQLPVPAYCLLVLLPFLAVAWHAFRMFRLNFRYGILPFILALAYGLMLYTQPVRVRLKKVGEEDVVPLSGRKVLLVDKPGLSFYHTPMTMEMKDPRDKSVLLRQNAVFHVDQNMDVVMELPPDAPECFRHPAIPFQLYDRDGLWVNHGFTKELCSEQPDLFRIQFKMKEEDGTLNKDKYYIVRIEYEGRKETFYAVSEAYDALESLKTGQAVYEMRLYHRQMLQKKLPLPSSVLLYGEDGKFICSGSVTCYFATRYLFERRPSADAAGKEHVS